MLVYRGTGSYRLRDEEGGIAFEVSCDGETVRLDIKPTSDCKTRTIKVRFCDALPLEKQTAAGATVEEDCVTLPLSECAIVARVPEQKAEEGGSEPAEEKK